MKLVVLAFDGLEADLVEEWNLSNLMQWFYGTYRVEVQYPSPVLWSSFLTGLPPTRFKSEFVERSVPSFLRNLGFPNWVKKLGGIFFKPKPPTVKNRFKTLFEEVDSSLPFNFFMYNEVEEQFKLRLKYSLPETVGKRRKSREACRSWIALSIKFFNRFLNLIEDGNWSLTATHFFYTDIVGHLFYERDFPLTLHRAYRLADGFAKEVRNALNGNDALLIVSDHGMEAGIHTDHGFYSCSKRLPFKPKAITDFHDLILELCDDD